MNCVSGKSKKYKATAENEKISVSLFTFSLLVNWFEHLITFGLNWDTRWL